MLGSIVRPSNLRLLEDAPERLEGEQAELASGWRRGSRDRSSAPIPPPIPSPRPRRRTSTRSCRPQGRGQPLAPASSGPARTRSSKTSPARRPDNPLRPGAPHPSTIAADARARCSFWAAAWGSFGSYAKVLLVDGVAAATAQFGPLSALPSRPSLRELYKELPQAPLPAVITCVATTARPDAAAAPSARCGGL